jgi:L-iditol 2-dehydrogenase
LIEPGRVELRRDEEPAGDGALALLEIRAVGICGSDLRIFSGRIPVDYPRIMGHEIVGDVISAPDEGPEPGTTVVVDPTVACGECERCLEGRENLCSNGWLLGRDRDGGLRERIAVPAGNLYAIPPGLDAAAATLIQVLTTCVHAQDLQPVSEGDSVAIVGLGVTGLLHLQLAKLRGASPVVCVTRSARKLELARELGADVAIPATDQNAVEAVREATGGGADVAIECAGSVETLGMAVEAARTGGRVLAFGTIASTDGPFPFYELYHKELVLTSPRAARAQDFPVAVEAVASGQVRLDGLVTHRLPLRDASEAFGIAGSPDALKVVVEI